MRFLADENFPLAVIHAMREHGHDFTSIWESARGSDDEAVLARSHTNRASWSPSTRTSANWHSVAALRPDGIVLFRIQAHDPTLLAHRILNVIHSQPNWRGVFASVDEECICVRPLPPAPSATA